MHLDYLSFVQVQGDKSKPYMCMVSFINAIIERRKGDVNYYSQCLNVAWSSHTGNQYWSAPSIATLPHPAYQRGSLPRPFRELKALGELILGPASRLDAFSGYPFQTQLPCNALGRTTGTPEVCPSRSSRTKDRFPQFSNAHGRQGPNCLTTF